MAYRVEKRSPIDIEDRRAVGVALPFSSESVFKSTYRTIDAYRTNIINYLLTSKGERYFNPEFGNSLRDLLFEPGLNEIRKKSITTNLTRELNYYFPKLVIDLIEISDKVDHVIQIYIKFHVKDSRLGDELVINFE